jgi:hypothetical protein
MSQAGRAGGGIDAGTLRSRLAPGRSPPAEPRLKSRENPGQQYRRRDERHRQLVCAIGAGLGLGRSTCVLGGSASAGRESPGATCYRQDLLIDNHRHVLL